MFEEPAKTPEGIACIEVSSQEAQETSIDWRRSENSVIQSRPMKPIGWMKKQKKVGNLSSEQFQALKHLRNKEDVARAVKGQLGADPSTDGSGSIPTPLGPGKVRTTRVKDHSSGNTSRIADDRQDAIARIKRTRQARSTKNKAKAADGRIIDV